MRLRRGLRVLQVIYQDPATYPPTVNAARVFAAGGAQVSCLGYRRPPNAEVALPPGVTVRYLNEGQAADAGILGRAANVLALRRETRHEIERFAPDLVIAYDHGAGWGVAPFLPGRRFKAVLHLHDLLNTTVTRFKSSDGWMWAEMAASAARFDAIVVPERQRADYLRDEWHMHGTPRIVANSPPRAVPARNNVLRTRIDAARPPKRLAVIVGNMGLYLEAVRGLAAAREEWHLALIGCGHGPSIVRMLEEARTLGIERRVHIEAYTPYDTVHEWLRGCDAGLAFYPSTTTNVNWRTMGSASVKVQEYMSAAIPSIVCARRTFEALARDTGALEVLEEEAPGAIAAALDRLEPGGAHHARMSKAALDAHLGRFNCEAQLQPLIDALGLDAEADAFQ